MIRTGGQAAARLCCLALCIVCGTALAGCAQRGGEESTGGEAQAVEESAELRHNSGESMDSPVEETGRSAQEPPLVRESAAEPEAQPEEEPDEPVTDDLPQADSDLREPETSGEIAAADAQEAVQVDENPQMTPPGQQTQTPPQLRTELQEDPEEQQRSAALRAGQLDEARVEVLVLQLINADRLTHGREGLGMQEDMRLAARIRAGEVLESLSHTRPDGTGYNTAFDEAGFTYAGKYHGENVLQMQSPPDRFTDESLAQRIFDELKDSTGHYRNMMQDTYVQAGIGVHIRERDGVMDVGCAQLFAGM